MSRAGNVLQAIYTTQYRRTMLLAAPLALYQRLGFGLYLTVLKDTGVPIGLCGLIKHWPAAGAVGAK